MKIVFRIVTHLSIIDILYTIGLCVNVTKNLVGLDHQHHSFYSLNYEIEKDVLHSSTNNINKTAPLAAILRSSYGASLPSTVVE